MAVAITGFLLLLLRPNDLDFAQPAEGGEANGNGVAEVVPSTQAFADEEPGLPVEAVEEVGITGAD